LNAVCLVRPLRREMAFAGRESQIPGAKLARRTSCAHPIERGGLDDQRSSPQAAFKAKVEAEKLWVRNEADGPLNSTNHETHGENRRAVGGRSQSFPQPAGLSEFLLFPHIVGGRHRGCLGKDCQGTHGMNAPEHRACVRQVRSQMGHAAQGKADDKLEH